MAKDMNEKLNMKQEGQKDSNENAAAERDNRAAMTVNAFVTSMINKIDKPGMAGEKAVWRHAFAKPVCGDIEAWSLLQRDIPDRLAGNGGTPSYAENAVYMAIASYAACKSLRKGSNLAHAAAAIGNNAREKFTRIEKTDNLDELWLHLRRLLMLISSNRENGIDYGLLARDLESWQFDRARTVLKWERDFYFSKKSENISSGELCTID